jgi:AcrR family transcriptional regulator
MSPRAYRLGKRQAVIDEGRRRILDAARALLREATSYPDFTVDAVARDAGVARATVYYQFTSKTGLLEAVCDDLAEAGGLETSLPQAFTQPAPAAALGGFVAAFARFWAADRLVMRRLRALASLDPDVAAVIGKRDQRRLTGLSVLAERILGYPPGPQDEVLRVLQALTSFETYDTLAGDGDPAGTATLVTALAQDALARCGRAGSAADGAPG